MTCRDGSLSTRQRPRVLVVCFMVALRSRYTESYLVEAIQLCAFRDVAAIGAWS